MLIVDMAQIGKKIKKIEIVPEREPDPTFVPDEPSVPERAPANPEKEPAKVCATMSS